MVNTVCSYLILNLFSLLGAIIPQRVVLSLMGFLGIVVSFTMRACLSIAITEMVVPVNNTGKSDESLICPVDPTPVESNNITTVVSFQCENMCDDGKILALLIILLWYSKAAPDIIGLKRNKDGSYPHFSLDI